jgi:hypothetical protein
MDVLVRLATEPPDLSGLPAELDGIVTACLARSPRQRPSSAALLDQLGPFVAAPPGPRSAHAYLPAPAMAVISGYQHGPREAVPAAAAGAGERTSGGAGQDTSGGTENGSGDQATLGSHTGLPVPPDGGGRPLQRSAGQPAPAGSGAGTAAPPPARHPRRRPALIGAGLATAAAVLIGGGVIAGVTLAGTDGGTSTANLSQGTFNPPPGPPPSAFPVAPSGSPQIVMLQPIGDQATVFLIHGTGWAPLTRVTVSLAGHGRSPVRPVVDMQGTFNYAVNQGHEFFPRRIPPGVYHIVVTGPAGRRARASFQVNPPPGQRPPPG